MTAIVLNGCPARIEAADLSYEDIVGRLRPDLYVDCQGLPFTGPDVCADCRRGECLQTLSPSAPVYSIAWYVRGGASGSLRLGQSIPVVPGLVVNAMVTGSA